MSQANDNAAVAKSLFNGDWEQLTSHEREVIEDVLSRISAPRDVNKEFIKKSTYGERASDTIAAFGGSWTFILMFFVGLVSWAVVNTEILGPLKEAFDPYPYVFLNLILSMLAAIQAPIIMMSQNRQSAKDRLDAEIDHSVNVRAELTLRELRQRLHRIEKMLAANVPEGAQQQKDQR
ncbi:MAG: DUF1003 domain-containing protein [Methylobacter sp.]|nr:DUF1003 domain-containing protein [Methylococcales bacterium]MDD5112897.1 DUF1003 domain-containing protein [Methylobacter sp.]